MPRFTAHWFLGKDATDAFEDVGHSDEAREILAGSSKNGGVLVLCEPYDTSALWAAAGLEYPKLISRLIRTAAADRLR